MPVNGWTLISPLTVGGHLLAAVRKWHFSQLWVGDQHAWWVIPATPNCSQQDNNPSVKEVNISVFYARSISGPWTLVISLKYRPQKVEVWTYFLDRSSL
jgi:hypothetical protein